MLVSPAEPNPYARIRSQLKTKAANGTHPTEWKAEYNRRYAIAKMRAMRVLVAMHPDDFAPLLQAARAEVDAERGQMPGDD